MAVALLEACNRYAVTDPTRCRPPGADTGMAASHKGDDGIAERRLARAQVDLHEDDEDMQCRVSARGGVEAGNSMPPDRR